MTMDATRQQGDANNWNDSRALAVACLVGVLMAVGVFGFFAEEDKPGYSIVSQIFRNSEAVEAARKAAEDRRGAAAERIRKENEAREKRKAEAQFVRENTTYIGSVVCPRPNWPTLSPEDKQRVLTALKQAHVLLLESENCP